MDPAAPPPKSTLVGQGPPSPGGASAPTELAPGQIVAGRYRVVDKIGHGGMGAVYHVRHEHTDEELALKVLHPNVLRDAQAVQRFQKEARAPARIASEHVARVTDADTAEDLGGAPFYVMELLRGRDLEQELAARGALPVDEVVELLRQTARALDKAHGLGIVHRDLKPENLFVTTREGGGPCVKLLDFGIARLADGDAPTHATQAGFVFGTPTYMAPEQTLGEPDKVGPWTDVWALGLVAFRLLVGHDYFDGKTTPRLFSQILAEPLPSASERGARFGPAFDAWLARAVARDVAERFGSAGEAVRALAEALGVSVGTSQASISDVLLVPAAGAGPSGTQERASGPGGVPAPPRTRGAKIAAVGALALVVVGLGGVLARRAAGRVEEPPYPLVGATSAPTNASGAPAAPPPGPDDAPETSGGALAPATASATRPAKPSADPAPARPAAPAASELSREQKKRLASLERLCAQGTFKPAECQAKRQAILKEGR